MAESVQQLGGSKMNFAYLKCFDGMWAINRS